MSKKIEDILLQEIHGGFCNVPKMDAIKKAASAIEKYIAAQPANAVEWLDEEIPAPSPLEVPSKEEPATRPLFPLDVPDEVYKEASSSAYLSPEVCYDKGTSDAYIQGFCTAHARFSQLAAGSPSKEDTGSEGDELLQLRGLLHEVLVRAGIGLPAHEEFVDLFDKGFGGENELMIELHEALFTDEGHISDPKPCELRPQRKTKNI
jgi:hypothetical protein